jgi:hypothetical protein
MVQRCVCVRACVRACACVYICMYMCVCVCVYVRTNTYTSQIRLCNWNTIEDNDNALVRIRMNT